MNILVLCPHYAPDVAPTGEVMTSIVTELAARGHRLHVVTALPWYQHHRVDDGWTGSWVRTDEADFGWITRLHPFPTDKANIPARALAFGGFTGLSLLAGLRPKFRPDVVLAMSPPLILGLPGWLLARRWRVPFVFNIQDVFPDVAIEVGAIRSPRVIAAARWLERFLYRRSDAVTVLSDDLRDNLAAKLAGHRPERVEVIPNFVDTERIRPGERANSYRDEFGLGDRVVVMYAGNLGFSQSVEVLLDAAAAFRSDPDVVFVVNGGGSARADLVERAKGLDNVVFVGMQPKERLPEVLAAADVHTVLLKEGLARSSVPSKLYSILASGRPCVASVDPGTEVSRTLEDADAGSAVGPGDVESFTKAVARLVADPGGAGPTGGQRASLGRAVAVARSGRGVLRGAVRARGRHALGARAPQPLSGSGPSDRTTLSAVMGKASSAKKIQRVQRAGVSRSAGQRRALGFPALIIGILIVGSVLVAFARDSKTEATADAPAANVDHWHAAFGVYECDKYLPNVPDSESDPTGIHTHGDGLIHIHPFVAAASGKNADFGVYADTVGMTIDGETVTMPLAMGAQELKDGATCTDAEGNKVEATLQMLVWPPQATEDVDPEVVKGDFADIRFTEDGQIFTLALLPKGTSPNDVPLPPSVEQLKDPLAAEGGGTQQPTDPGVTIPVDPNAAPVDPSATSIVPAETPSAPATTPGG